MSAIDTSSFTYDVVDHLLDYIVIEPPANADEKRCYK